MEEKKPVSSVLVYFRCFPTAGCKIFKMLIGIQHFNK